MLRMPMSQNDTLEKDPGKKRGLGKPKLNAGATADESRLIIVEPTDLSPIDLPLEKTS